MFYKTLCGRCRTRWWDAEQVMWMRCMLMQPRPRLNWVGQLNVALTRCVSTPTVATLLSVHIIHRRNSIDALVVAIVILCYVLWSCVGRWRSVALARAESQGIWAQWKWDRSHAIQLMKGQVYFKWNFAPHCFTDISMVVLILVIC